MLRRSFDPHTHDLCKTNKETCQTEICEQVARNARIYDWTCLPTRRRPKTNPTQDGYTSRPSSDLSSSFRSSPIKKGAGGSDIHRYRRRELVSSVGNTVGRKVHWQKKVQGHWQGEDDLSCSPEYDYWPLRTKGEIDPTPSYDWKTKRCRTGSKTFVSVKK